MTAALAPVLKYVQSYGSLELGMQAVQNALQVKGSLKLIHISEQYN
jgi:hypothetical protein